MKSNLWNSNIVKYQSDFDIQNYDLLQNILIELALLICLVPIAIRTKEEKVSSC